MKLEELHYKKLLEDYINSEWDSYYLKHESSDGYYCHSYIVYKNNLSIEYRVGSTSSAIPYKELYKLTLGK